MNTYRVWMKDGYAILVNAENTQAAAEQAVELTRNDFKGVVMTPRARKAALAIDRIETLHEATPNPEVR